jgi:hypothetical protein
MGSTAKIAVAAAVEVLLHRAWDEEALDSMDDTVGLGDGGVADAHRGTVAALRGSCSGELALLHTDAHRGTVAALRGSCSGELALLAGERVRGNEDCSLALHNLLPEVYENE